MNGKEQRRRERAWCLYDWGNSAFALVCMTAVLPPYLASLVNAERGAPAGTATWGWAASAGLLAGVVLGPPLGALADSRGWRKLMLGAFAIGGSLATCGLALALPSHWPWALALYVVAASAFAGANLFYDALLPGLVPRENWDELSARGYAFGYVGGGLVLLATAALWLALGDAGLRAGFLLTGLWWAVFTLPLLRRVPEPRWARGGRLLERLRQTVRDARMRPALWRFLIAYWLYNDGIGTIIKMAAAYGSEVGIPFKHLLGALLLTQVVGVPATVGFGRLGRRFGPRVGIYLALAGYTAVAVLGLFLAEAWHFWVLAGLVGLVQGGAQALSRSLYARLLPPGREAEYFSFFDVSGRIAGVIGPALFAAATTAWGSGRMGVVVVLVLFVAGAWILRGVRLEAGTRDPS